MSQLGFVEKLLDGADVEWKPLGEVAEYSKTRISFELLDKNNYVGVDNLLQNRAGKVESNYLPTSGNLTEYCECDILIGNIRPYLKKIWSADRVGGTNGDVLVIHPTYKSINPRYLYQVLTDEKFFDYNMQHSKGAKMPRGNKAKIMEYSIPIPCPEDPKKSLEIQAEIVRILDTFTEPTAELTAKLTAELTERKKQYAYYRDQLLTFEEEEVEWKTLGDVVKPQRGKRLVKKQLEEFGNYAVYQNSMTPLGYYHESNVKSDTTFLISAGAAGEIGYSDVDFWAADDVYYFLTPDNIESKFLYHFLITQQNKIYAQVRRASVPRLSKKVVENLRIPIPSLAEQSRIVSILDKFDALTNSITAGLQREIELRQKQYEYYREQLLSFPKGAAEA